MDTFEQVKQGLFDVLFLIQNLNIGQITGLCQFVTPNSPIDLNTGVMLNLQSLTPDDMDQLIKAATSGLDQSAEKMAERPETIQFTQLYHLLLLQGLLRELSFPQLFKFFDITAGRQLHEQLQIFKVLQELFAKLDTETMMILHQEFNEVLERNQGEPMELPHVLAQVISSHLQLSPDLFYLYEPMRILLTLPLQELEHLQSFFPHWDHTRLCLLTRLIEVGNNNPWDVQDIIRLLVPMKTVEYEVPSDTSNNRPIPSTMLEIVEQPPEKCVYKRNVKPAPTIMITGDQTENDGNMYIQPILIRCDTFEEIPNLLDGGQRIKITSGRTIIFKRLKILSTSHQLNETLFSLKFELRRYDSSDHDKFEMLHSVTTSPICVVSHSTQLKATSKTLPIVVEVIPYGGPPSGATRVAILGSNFVESPTTLVKFDNMEVKPYFHGPKTLICHTPKHPPGTVSVKVCNDLNRWSETEGTYTYHGPPAQDDEQTISLVHEYNLESEDDLLNGFDPNGLGLEAFAQMDGFGAEGHGFVSPLRNSIFA